MKSLEALKELDEHCITWHDNPTKEKIKIIEKELKVLEILKNKQIKLSLIKDPTINSYDIYNFYISEKEMLLTKEEFDPLKEVLSND